MSTELMHASLRHYSMETSWDETDSHPTEELRCHHLSVQALRNPES